VAEIERHLTRIDAAVAALKRVQANLKRYRASLLKAACEGRLVPTEAGLARAAGREYEHASVLLERILKERRAKWAAVGRKGKYKEPLPPDFTTLPPLPEGWVWATVEQLAWRIQYGTSAKANSDSDGVPVLRMGNIQEGKLDYSDLKYLPSHHPDLPPTLLDDGDLLFNRTNSAELVGKTAVFYGNHNRVSFASYLIRVSFLEEYLPKYVSSFINSDHGRRYMRAVQSQQVGQANVNGTKLAQMPVPLPPATEQHRIVAEVERRLSVVQAAERAVETNLRRADRLRQAVLKRAFEGKLVAQDPSDEPASVLLERIRAERQRLGENGNRKRPRNVRRRKLQEAPL
jgi:type I restriction enzyme S subunit